MNRRTMRAGYRVREIIASGTRTNWPADIYKLHFALARPFVFSDGRARSTILLFINGDGAVNRRVYRAPINFAPYYDRSEAFKYARNSNGF